MPPSGARRPDRATIDAFTAKLEAELDRAAAANPNPGATALHRLNRSEYTNVDSRLARAGRGCHNAAYSRRFERGFRQHRRRFESLSRAAGALRLRRGEGQPPGGGRSVGRRHGGNVSLRRRIAARTHGGPALRNAWRHSHPPPLPARRRIHLQSEGQHAACRTIIGFKTSKSPWTARLSRPEKSAITMPESFASK